MKNIILFVTLLCITHTGFSQKTDDLETGTLAASNIDPARIQAMETEIDKGNFPNIHSVLIARHNKLLYEKYWPGKDEVWGNDKGVVQHSKDDLHDIRSISKSIVSACVGIAIAQGKIKSVDQKVFAFFPEYAKYDTGWKSSWTIEHLLTMTSGLVWNEEVPYDNPENSEIQMIKSASPIEYVLSRPMETEPGKVWEYNGGTTQLLAAIIQKVSGKPVDQFASTYLFQPLGITKFEWVKYPGKPLPAAASGLRLRPRDLLKFGLLYNNDGNWKGKQIVPAQWIAQSFQSHATRPDGGGYGYQFWLFSDTVENKPVQVVVAVGNGDQRIFFDKKDDVVVVVTAGNYNKWNIRNNSTGLMRGFIGPAIAQQ